eukprot:scaffold283_cov316-Pavlova_lutheri.AAC.15
MLHGRRKGRKPLRSPSPCLAAGQAASTPTRKRPRRGRTRSSLVGRFRPRLGRKTGSCSTSGTSVPGGSTGPLVSLLFA